MSAAVDARLERLERALAQLYAAVTPLLGSASRRAVGMELAQIVAEYHQASTDIGLVETRPTSAPETRAYTSTGEIGGR